jgi:hypothetical protein
LFVCLILMMWLMVFNLVDNGIGRKETSSGSGWSAKPHDLCWLLPVLCFFHSPHSGDANC